MKFLLVEQNQIVSDRVQLRPDQIHHVRDVLRIGPREELRVVAPSLGQELLCQVSKRPGLLKIQESSPLPAPPLPEVAIGLAWIKGARIDEAVEGLTALGIDRVYLMRTARTAPRKDPSSRLARLSRIVRKTCQQSGRYHLPRIEAKESLEDVVKEHLGRPCDLYILVPESRFDRDQTLLPRPGEPVTNAQIALIGPEGGFTPDEIDRMEKLGASPIKLKSHVLRSELAAIVMASLLLSRVGRL